MKTTEARRSLEHSGRRRTQGFRPQAEAGRWEHPADSLVSDSSSWRQSFPRLLPVTALGKIEMKSLNVVIILLLVLSLLSSLMSSGFTCCNTVTNPYQTFLGPIGVYTWNSLNGIFILLIMILFAVNVEANKLSVELASNCVFSSSEYKNSRNNYEYSYWLMLLIFLLNVATIIIIVFYHHARYSKRKEQERPIENAPKDGILF
ncbi:clarin-3 isoform X2 [Caretta caretta]|uniref:clarin-3 isoform X2 n=1 Tax=Caretta caretta TaxID=8467 RepID=UPI00209498F6|nr:clarin-3 isoform X2 [Caretta caretta]